MQTTFYLVCLFVYLNGHLQRRMNGWLVPQSEPGVYKQKLPGTKWCQQFRKYINVWPRQFPIHYFLGKMPYWAAGTVTYVTTKKIIHTFLTNFGPECVFDASKYLRSYSLWSLVVLGQFASWGSAIWCRLIAGSHSTVPWFGLSCLFCQSKSPTPWGFLLSSSS